MSSSRVTSLDAFGGRIPLALKMSFHSVSAFGSCIVDYDESRDSSRARECGVSYITEVDFVNDVISQSAV